MKTRSFMYLIVVVYNAIIKLKYVVVWNLLLWYLHGTQYVGALKQMILTNKCMPLLTANVQLLNEKMPSLLGQTT